MVPGPGGRRRALAASTAAVLMWQLCFSFPLPLCFSADRPAYLLHQIVFYVILCQQKQKQVAGPAENRK